MATQFYNTFCTCERTSGFRDASEVNNEELHENAALFFLDITALILFYDGYDLVLFNVFFIDTVYNISSLRGSHFACGPFYSVIYSGTAY